MTSGRVRLGWERLADVQVPKAIIWWTLLAAWLRQRKTDKALKELTETSSDFGTFLGSRMEESDERNRLLIDLQTTIERLTRWLVRLTVALTVIGVAGIGVACWAALK